MAPISLVQAVLAGGAVTLAVISQRLFGDPVERRQWLALLLGGAGLALLAVTLPHFSGSHSEFSLARDPRLRGRPGAARRRPRPRPPLPAPRRPPRRAPRRARRHPLRPRRDRDQGRSPAPATVSIAAARPLVALTSLCGVLAQYTAVAALQRGGAIETIGLMGLVANATQIAGGVLVFGDPLSPTRSASPCRRPPSRWSAPRPCCSLRGARANWRRPDPAGGPLRTPGDPAASAPANSGGPRE